MTYTMPPVWSLTWPQVLGYKLLTSMQGHTLRPQDDPNNASYVWRADVDRALTLKLPVPDEVISSRQRNAHPITSKNILKNAKGRPFTWSFSALQDFEGCSARYARRRFYCDVVEEETEALRWGNRVHKAAEDFIKGLPVSDAEAFAPVKKYAELFKSLGAEAEVEVCLDENLNQVEWFSPKAWYRGKLDVVIRLQESLKYFDWKTGKVKDDPDQLEICCATLSVLRPEVQVFDGKYIWLREQTTTGMKEPLEKDHLDKIWEKTLSRVERMKKAWQVETFPARPSGLCRFCPAAAGCTYKRG